MKWVSEMWDILSIYGKNEGWLLLWDRLKWQSVNLLCDGGSIILSNFDIETYACKISLKSL